MTLNLFLLSSLIFLSSCDKAQDSLAQINLQKAEEQRLKLLAEQEAKYSYVKGEIKRNQGMYQALKSLKVTNIDALSIINLLSDKVEFTKLKVGDKLMAKFDEHNKLIKFSFSNNPAEKHVLILDNHAKLWQYNFIEEPTFWKTRIVQGTINAGSTLQADLISKGLKRSVVGEVVNILLCKVNFRVYARAKDEFKVLLKERMFNDKVLETKVLYTSYNGIKAGFKETFLYQDGEKSTYTAHYTKDGEALIRSGLRYPVKRLHIKSSYGKRRHPVTGHHTMHRGVDLQGYRGAPVYAVARGRVIESKMTPLGGNKIAIRHNDNSVSYYLHLKRRHVKVGDRVRSHQQIGQVGATGRVTGPHLHFGFKDSRGRWMNPMHKRMIATPKLSGDRMKQLQVQISEIKSVFASFSDEMVTDNSEGPIPSNNI